MVVGTCCLQGRQPLPWGRSPVSFGQISLGSVFQGKSWDKGPSSLALPRMVHHPWPAAPNMIWHIYSHLYCSSRNGGRDLLSSGEVALTMRQVPCEFWADQPTFIFQSAAPDVFWHIYSHLYSSSRDGGRDLLSSGEAASTMGKVPCEFWADQPTFIFQPAAPDVIWHIYSSQCCFKGDLGMDLLSSGDVALTMGQVPYEFWAYQPTFIFQPAAPDMIWHIYSGQCCFKGIEVMDLSSSGDVALTIGQVPYEFWADQPTIIFQPVAPDVIWHIYSGQCCFKGIEIMGLTSSGDVALTMQQVPCEFWADCKTFIF